MRLEESHQFFSLRERAQILAKHNRVISCPPSLTIWDTAGLQMSERRGQTPRRIRVAGAGVGVGGVVESCVTR